VIRTSHQLASKCWESGVCPLMHRHTPRFCRAATHPQSCVDPSFWSELASRKLDEYKLSEAAVDITGMQRLPK